MSWSSKILADEFTYLSLDTQMLAQVSIRQRAITAISYILPILGEVFLQSETIRFLTSPSIRCETSVEEHELFHSFRHCKSQLVRKRFERQFITR
jgi:hypothetical protein